MKFSDYVSSYPIYFYMGYFSVSSSCFRSSSHFHCKIFFCDTAALDVYIERKIEDLKHVECN